MKPVKDYTLILIIGLIIVAALCSCGTVRTCPTNDSRFFYKHSL